MVPAFEDWQKLKRVGVTGRAWGIRKGNEGEQCCGGTERCWALTAKAVSRKKQENSPPSTYPLRAAGKGVGYSGIRRAEEGWALGQWAAVERKAQAWFCCPQGPRCWEGCLEERGRSCTASPRWGAAYLASGAQWLGVGASSSGNIRESTSFLPTLAQPLPQAGCLHNTRVYLDSTEKHVVEPGPAAPGLSGPGN